MLLDESTEWLNYARAEIETFLPARLGVRLNPAKTVIQPVSRGIDFVGQVLKPWHRTLRRTTFRSALRRLDETRGDVFFSSANSYFGLLRQATHSHADRAVIANLVRRRGFTVNGALTQTFRHST